jgi:nickel transport protein
MTDQPPFLRRSVLWVGVFALVFLLPVRVPAHNVIVFAWVEGDRVFTESKFSGGRMAKNAPIEVFDLEGNRLLEGRTDDNGRFDFPVPGPTGLRIVLSAGEGHGNEWILERDEIIEAAGGVGATMDTPPPRPSPMTIARGPDEVIPRDNDRLTALVEAAIDRKLTPVLRQLRQMNERLDKPSLKDIVGGIGYIMGLVGIAAYMASRRRRGSSGK